MVGVNEPGCVEANIQKYINSDVFTEMPEELQNQMLLVLGVYYDSATYWTLETANKWRSAVGLELIVDDSTPNLISGTTRGGVCSCCGQQCNCGCKKASQSKLEKYALADAWGAVGGAATTALGLICGPVGWGY